MPSLYENLVVINSFDSNGYGYGTAFCDTGDWATGGGFAASSSLTVIMESNPVLVNYQIPVGWYVKVLQPVGSGTPTTTVYAVCADVTTGS